MVKLKVNGTERSYDGDPGMPLLWYLRFLEVLNDALGSVAVIVAAAVIVITGWLQADAVASILMPC